jgi:hypothetical protein
MHFASFELQDPVFDAHGFALSLQIVTRENIYGLDPAQTSARSEGGVFVARAAGLACAGGQVKAPGAAILRVTPGKPGQVRVQIKAKGPEAVRCVKLLVRGLPGPLHVVEDGGDRPVGGQGEILAYPNRLATPLLFVRAGGELLGVRVEDERVREKRFALAIEKLGGRAGQGTLECILEEDATRFDRELEAPLLVLGRGIERDAFHEDHLRFLEGRGGLIPWRERADVPAFARELRLALTLHGMHWTGRVFLDYAGMLDVIRFAAERIDGRRVLAYLPGWEGRYYWQYGEYRPEPRLGGEAGFAALCEGARKLGVHVMPMFGGNCVNAWLPRFEALDPTARMKSPTRNRFHGNQPDWDFARAHDTGWQAWLNPGHPGWRDDLAGQVEGLAARFGFDGVFLDTIHIWVNDPDHAVHEGIRRLCARLRRAIPGVLLAAEHDFDALLPLFDLFQRAYWGSDPAWTAPYAMRFAHLCEGEPEGRTGVHEFGVWKTPGAPPVGDARPGYLPTIAFQDDTLARSQAEVARVIETAAKAG